MKDPEADEMPPRAYIAHLRPEDCNNLTSSMKAIITGFVDRPPAEDEESDEEDLRKCRFYFS